MDFSRDIRPILSDSCFTCHGPDKQSRDSELRLDTRAGALADLGGYRAILPGDADASEALARVTSDDPDLQMPPPDAGRKLNAGQIELLRRWIDEGAVWEEHWSFVPPRRPPPPKIPHADWPRQAIDCFIADRLQQHQLEPNREAARETLIRRVTLDLTGLPPTPAEVDAYLADQSSDAHERLVDRLLASPRYGEHMAAAWLDAARYSDTNGYQQDRTRTMWPWRDWVVDAMNAGMPFDQFTVEQLAGDLLPDAQPQQLLATGFHRNHPLNGEGGRIAEESRVEYVIDRVETTAAVWLGLTAGCGRCHDHKYDPISQEEFYQLYAFFNNIDESGGVDRGGNAAPVKKIPTPQQVFQQRRLGDRLAQLQRELETPPPADELRRWEQAALAELEATSHEGQWQLLPVAKTASDAGQQMKLLDDGSILVTGKNPVNDGYTVSLTAARAVRLTGLRLEALAHADFTAGGLARSNSGNFVLTDLRVHVAGSEGDGRPVGWKTARADFEQRGFPATAAVDGNDATGWAVHHPSNMQLNRTALFTFAAPVALEAGASLTVRLEFKSKHRHHNLGRFRLAGATRIDPTLDAQPAFPADLAAALRTAADRRTEQQRRRLLQEYRRTAPSLESARERIAQLEQELAALTRRFPEVMIMQERPSPRETFVLIRGQYDNPDRRRPVSAAVPSALPALAGDGPVDRMMLARWLTDRRNPLTARVTVNRLWQHFFGVGLVKTSEDFGSQGEPPSHPRLLDWLAVELMESGWNIKALQRQIVTSAAYRQASTGNAQRREADPQNRLISRGPRFRLSSLALRDQALALAGLLVERTGGPPVKPYQPSGVWNDFSLGKIKYQRDSGAALYRRSLYTFWRRSVGPTMLFDSASRQVCTVRQSRTNTPLHALTMLNDVTYVEAARKFAERMLIEGGRTDAARLRWGFRVATARRPTEVELQVLVAGLARTRRLFDDDPAAVAALLKVGESPSAPSLDSAQLAAYTAAANLLLNLDEVVTKE